MEELLRYSAQYGFPVVVSLFLLKRVDKTLSELRGPRGPWIA
jgi:hypothetical protein